MIRFLLLIWLAVAALPAGAAPVKVTTGAHQGFTRLVMEFGAPVNWSVGRTEAGYALKIEGQTPGYDLSQVFQLIGRERLAAIWSDPASGELRISIGCACHAIPFEFRPGIVVIDLRDGPPPSGSSFELALDGAEMPALATPADGKPPLSPGARTEGYDWTRPFLQPSPAEPAAARAKEPVMASPPQLAPLGDLALEPLREALLLQLSRGAAQGVVDMVLPAERTAIPAEDFASAAFRLGEQTNIAITGLAATAEDLTAGGAICVPDSRLTVENWADERPVSEQMGEMMTGLSGEFDHPDGKAVAKAIRFDLHLGFGAEARMVLQAFPSLQEDAAIWVSMAHILDQEPDPEPAFAGMLGCDTRAAFWAMLSDPPPAKGDVIAKGAVQRAFSALPLHLRRQLGPRLADRYLALDEADAAYGIQQAILRVKGDAGPEVGLMQARIAAHGGDLAAAEARTGAVLDDPGPAGAKALAAMVELRVARNEPVAADTVVALAAYLKERGTGAEAAALRRALILALAASGDFAGAFDGIALAPETAPDLWRLLAQLAPDALLLDHAMLAPDQIPPPAAQAVAVALAERLLALGFADQASVWARFDPQADPMFLVRIALQRRDGREALRLLAGRQEEAAQLARAEALRLLGDELAVAETLAALGQDEAQWAAERRAQDWPKVAEAGPPLWRTAAAAVATPATGAGAGDELTAPAKNPGSGQTGAAPPDPAAPPAGPLAESRALLADSAATRQAIADLLISVPPP